MKYFLVLFRLMGVFVLVSCQTKPTMPNSVPSAPIPSNSVPLVQTPISPKPSVSYSPKDMEELRNRILKLDYSVQKLAQSMGNTAVPTLTELMKNENSAVRELALVCLSIIGDHEAVKQMILALFDPNIQVRAVTLRSFAQHSPPDSSYKALLQVIGRSEHAYIRNQIGLVAGKLIPATIQDFMPILQREKDAEAQEAFITVLARLGYPQAQQAFSQNLTRAKDDTLARHFGYAKYISQPWLIKPLATHLNDETPLQWIGIDGFPNSPKELRACDFAAKIIVVLSRNRFAFMDTAPDPANYTPEQRQEIKEYVERLR